MYDDGEYTALHYAAGSGNTEIMELILGKGAYINQLSQSNSTPLHFAAAHNHVDAVRLLLNRGANPLAQDNNNSCHICIYLIDICLHCVLNIKARH